ncbi:hypothetical protein ABTB07_22305, partial [Acinetobacter baumannii]
LHMLMDFIMELLLGYSINSSFSIVKSPYSSMYYLSSSLALSNLSTSKPSKESIREPTKKIPYPSLH